MAGLGTTLVPHCKMKIDSNDLARLRSQTTRGELILFTGAGFSLGASNYCGQPVPSSSELKHLLWQLCYPDVPFDEWSSLGDLYAAALRRNKAELNLLLQTRFTVHPESLPEYYQRYFNFPWFRYYTLNIDDLEAAAARRFGLERQPVSVSARSTDVMHLPGVPFSARGLEAVHLNGLTPSPAEALTFSESQYAERIGNQEPWYSRCVVDITSRPVVFVGTVLNEALLWRHMELRRRRENLGRDLRPTSLLVCKELPHPRRDILRDLRINWIQATAEEFADEILSQITSEITRGFTFIRQHAAGRQSGYIPLVSQLVAEHPNLHTEYLLGEEPQWSDILSGRAVERTHDDQLLQLAQEVLDGSRGSAAIAITGTAGTGKSTALMSLAVKLSGNGIPVLWIDKDSDVPPSRMRRRVQTTDEKVVLAIDDADMYGKELHGLLADLLPERKDFLFVFATRSSKLDEITTALRGRADVKIAEHVVPPLNDTDIDGLIGVLEKNNRLGILTGAPTATRRAAFRDQAGRQLLVAMIRATSGEKLEKKAQDEYLELSGAQRYVYALVALATALRYPVTKDEILLANGDSHEEALVALERLNARHLIVAKTGISEYRCRHRVIAELVFDKLKELSELSEVVVGLAWALATKVSIPLDRTSKIGRFLIRLMNHDFLLRTIGFMNARDLYSRLEQLLSTDYHYWLQRGSLEVEAGEVRTAENFLNAARSLGSGDFRVDTAHGYMLMRKAWEAPTELHAEEILDAGIKELEDVIDSFGEQSQYPYHVLGTQGLKWARRGIPQNDARRAFLQKLLTTVDDGRKFHPQEENLRVLQAELKKEILLTLVDI
jgi:Mrp family chromosome partitioning ATPase